MPTCDEIKEAARKYNSDYSDYDLALTSAREAIQDMPLSVGRFLAEAA